MGIPEQIKERALEAGFDLVGIAPARGLEDFALARQWQRKGFAGEMGYLANPRRFDPRAVLPSVRSVVCVGLVYSTDYPYSTESGSQQAYGHNGQRTVDNGRARISNFDFRVPRNKSSVSSFEFPVSRAAEPRGWISRYAWGRDYHEILRDRLEKLRAAIEALAPEIETRVYVDTGPVIERAFARHSGIGWVGKNTCVLNEQKGSWFFLGVILTDLDLEPDLPAPDRCGSCTACLEACPTGALVEPYKMDATRCISYLTIELRGSIPPEFRSAMGNHIFGCDICQDVCPWNRPSSFARGPSSEAVGLQPSVVRDDSRSRPATAQLPEFKPMTLGLKKLETGNWKLEERNPKLETGGTKIETRNSKLAGDSDASRAIHPPPTTHNQKPTGPANRQSSIINHQFPVPDTFSLFHPPLASLASMTEADFRRAFRHSPIQRAKYRGWLRNLCVAMGNSGDPRFIPWLAELAHGHDAMLREHAEWALERLRPRP